MIDAVKTKIMLGTLAACMAVGISGIIAGLIPATKELTKETTKESITINVDDEEKETLVSVPGLLANTLNIEDEQVEYDNTYAIVDIGEPVAVPDNDTIAKSASTSIVKAESTEEVVVEDLIEQPEEMLPQPTNSPIPTPTNTPTPTEEPTPVVTEEVEPVATETPTPEPTATETPTPTPTEEPADVVTIAPDTDSDTSDIIKSATNEQLLTCMIVTEAGENDYEEMIATASVIINRMNKYGVSMYDIVTQPGQFGVYSNGSLGRALEAYISGSRSYSAAHAAAVEVLNNGPSYSWTSFNAYSSYMEASQPDGEKLGNSWFYNYH